MARFLKFSHPSTRHRAGPLAAGIVLFAGVLLVACGTAAAPTSAPTATKPPAPTAMAPTAAVTVTVSLTPVGGSGQSGYATLTSLGDRTEVIISVSPGPTGVAQPAHIHDVTAQGGANCALPPKVVYPLTNVVDGKSTTTVQVSVAALQSKPYAVCVHKSAAEVTTYTAEGAIPRNPSAGAMPGPEALTVKLADYRFVPDVLKVQAGKKARFTVTGDSRSHTFTVEKLGVDVPVAANATQAIEFDVPAGSSGEIVLVCRIHETSRGMVGKVQISPPGGDSY